MAAYLNSFSQRGLAGNNHTELNNEVDKLKNRANCDKSMKLGENTQFDMRNKIGYRPLLENAPMCYF